VYGERNGGNEPRRFAWKTERIQGAQEQVMRTILKAVYSSVIAAVLLSGSSLLIGCHTVEGAGKDTKSVGNAVEDAAKDARH
jgi:predicted small secreted protein